MLSWVFHCVQKYFTYCLGLNTIYFFSKLRHLKTFKLNYNSQANYKFEYFHSYVVFWVEFVFQAHFVHNICIIGYILIVSVINFLQIVKFDQILYFGQIFSKLEKYDIISLEFWPLWGSITA